MSSSIMMLCYSSLFFYFASFILLCYISLFFYFAASTCTSGECLISGSDSYELPWERQWHTPEADEGTLDGWSQEEVSSHSSSSPSSCPYRLKGWGWHPSEGSFLAAGEGPSGTRPDSTDESEHHVPGASSKLHDCHLVEGKLEPPDVLLVPERPPERERRVPRRRDVPGRLPEEAEPQVLPRFAQLNVCERSAYGTENGTVWSARSLEIQVVLPPAPVAKPSRPRQTFPNQKPARSALRNVLEEATPRASRKTRRATRPQQKRLVSSTCTPKDFHPEAFALQNMGKETRERLEHHVKKKKAQGLRGMPSVVIRSLRLFRTLEYYCLQGAEATPRASPRTRQTPPPPQQKRLVSSTCTPEDFDPEAFALQNMDKETRERLEHHVKKKKAQGWSGIPSLVIRSLRLFRALEDYRRERGPKKPTPKLQLRPVQAVARNHLDALSRPAKHLQRLPGNKASSLLHPVAPETAKKLALSHRAAFHGPRETDPDQHRRLRFHRQVKMADIKRGTCPAAVEDSARRCRAPSPSLPLLNPKHPRGKALPASPGQHLRRPSSQKPPRLPPPPEEPVEALEQPLELPGKDEAEEGPPDEERGREEAGGHQLELAGTPRCTALLPSEEKDVEPPKPPLEPPTRDEAAAGPEDGRGGLEEASSLQLELVVLQGCRAPPPSEENVEAPEAEETQPQRDSSSSGVPSLALNAEGGAAAAAPGAEGEERLPGNSALPPSSVQGTAEAHKKGKRPRPERERSQPFRRGAPPPFARERAAATGGRKAGSRRERPQRGPPGPSSDQRRAEGGQTRARPKPGCVPWECLCPCLEWAKDKVKRAVKRLMARLRRRPRQEREGP
ncbi:uncharacterized protein LOC140702541 [Pogona vitticeps]